jgi:small subunit ribosomal protein S1
MLEQSEEKHDEVTHEKTPEETPELTAPLTNFDYSDSEVPNYDKTIKVFSEGDVIAGTVVKVDKDEVLLDIGYKSEGVIPARELSIRYGVKAEEVVEVGDEIDALVLQKEDKEGRLILSKKRAQYEQAWGSLEKNMIDSEPVEGEVIEVVKGGLILDIGLRGFLPASLVDIHRVKELDTFLGNKLVCKIIEMDRNRNNVVLSRRAFLEETASERRKVLLDNLNKGMRVSGKVSSIVSFGAFVNLGGIDGLIHISELSWCHVEKPSEVLSVGDEVDVEILEVDIERERISLSLKACLADPWEQLSQEVQIGEIIDGSVTKLVPFGAFVQVRPGIEGLIHISELSRRHVEQPDEVVQVGQGVSVKVIDIDIDRRRISLSLKQLEEELPEEFDEEVEREEMPAAVEEAAEEELVEEAAEEAAEEVAEEIVEEPAEEVVEEAAEEEPVEEAAEEASEQAVEEVAVEIVEEPAEEVAAEETIEEVVEEAAEEEPVEEAAEEASEQAVEEVLEEAIEEVAEEIVEEPAEEVAAEEVVEEAAEEEPVEEAAEEAVEEYEKEAVEEVVEELLRDEEEYVETEVSAQPAVEKSIETELIEEEVLESEEVSEQEVEAAAIEISEEEPSATSAPEEEEEGEEPPEGSLESIIRDMKRDGV